AWSCAQAQPVPRSRNSTRAASSTAPRGAAPVPAGRHPSPPPRPPPPPLAGAPRPAAGDPLAEALGRPAQVGTIALDPAGRRRMRVNGRSAPDGAGGLRIAADQVFANCPKHIHRRSPADGPPGLPSAAVSDRLTLRQQLAVSTADTFFIATAGPDGGIDASHRGGSPGFVTVAGEDELAWPDYPGNAMFMTLGNLELDPRAGLLVPDWEGGGALLLTGRARVEWSGPTARTVGYRIERVVELSGATSLTWTDEEAAVPAAR
ncbi:pyridoxamine 5'-phosphate oxidase family protein, partial [Kitasatospora sp. NPDC059571]|uniref:pyridoxamine 5'-phosphate oxidase family protein n=1 Tax=Kitasatospora sp. NPDC059571 TaxID=3346871 RepID=UPI0036B942AC